MNKRSHERHYASTITRTFCTKTFDLSTEKNTTTLLETAKDKNKSLGLAREYGQFQVQMSR